MNIPRQNFCQAETGRNKAEALATRYGHARGVDIAAVTVPFRREMLPHAEYNHIYIFIGCVDNAAARKAIAKTLDRNYSEPGIWWLDCGNAVQSGQVLLGSTNDRNYLKNAFKVPTFCTALPSPALQHPELLKPLPEERKGTQMSCAQIAAANFQALTVNKQVAAHAATMLRLFLTHELRYHALYFDQASGAAHAKYITPESVIAFGPQEKV